MLIVLGISIPKSLEPPNSGEEAIFTIGISSQTMETKSHVVIIDGYCDTAMETSLAWNIFLSYQEQIWQ